MRYIEKDLGNRDFAYIIPISDLHIGDVYFNEEKFIKLRDWVKEQENAFVILLGDILNCATKNSISDVYSELKNPQQAKKYAFNLLKPIKDRILGMVSGNHEKRIWRESGNDISEDLSMLLECDYDREGLFFNIKLGNYKNNGRVNYTVYCTHGTGAGRTAGAKANMLKRASEIVLADIYITGHIHHMQSFADYYFVPDVRHKRIDKVKRLYVSSASFLEWGGYAEEKMLPPSKTGCPRIRLDGIKKDFHVSI